MSLKDIIRGCGEVCGLSGGETQIAEYLKDELRKIGIKAYIDSAGNVHGRKESKDKETKTILLEAHMDQIGLMVSGIDEDGYIKFVNLGGIDERILCAMEVTILSNPSVSGIIGAVPPQKDESGELKNIGNDDLRIDIGLTKDEAEKMIKIGDRIMIHGNFAELLGSRVSGAAMDNRAGVSSILYCLKRAAGLNLPYNIEVLFSTQEELGLHGAYTGIAPDTADAAIAVDVTHGTTPDSKEETGVFPLGSGAVICCGPNLHYDYTKQLIKMAKNNKIPYEIEVASGGSGTTAWAIQTIGSGIPVMLVSIPLRYMHTNVETIDVSDAEAVSDLLLAAIKGGIKIA